MPFVTKEEREMLASDNKKVPDSPGQWCYLFYLDMIKSWEREPRWTTADAIYSTVREYEKSRASENLKRANNLAWQVFFNLHVMPYERLKRKQNGDI